MQLNLKRKIFTDESTIGELFIDGEFVSYILEDKFRGNDLADKIKHETAIPEGRYQVVVTFSNRFQKDLPLLVNVPGFEGIRIHSGNISANTSGCLLPGTSHGKDVVNNSRVAFAQVFAQIKRGLGEGAVFITVENDE